MEEDGKCTYWMLLVTPYACNVPFDETERLALWAADAAQQEVGEGPAAAREAVGNGGGGEGGEEVAY